MSRGTVNAQYDWSIVTKEQKWTIARPRILDDLERCLGLLAMIGELNITCIHRLEKFTSVILGYSRNTYNSAV